MSNEKYNNADYIENEEKMNILTPFKMFTLTKFPFIEDTFDALNNYQFLSKVVEYLNKVIENENNVTTNTHNLYNAYLALQIHVNDYFENLDVQDEINKKLDDLVIDGTMDLLIEKYIEPHIEEINLLVHRMDSFTRLNEGSTTGDAEIIDGRIGANGETYDNLGSAIRNQFQQINNNSIRKVDVKFLKGVINGTTGLMELTSDVRCCSDLIKVNGKIIISMTTNNYNYALFYYNENKKIIGQDNLYSDGSQLLCITENRASYVSVMLKKPDGSVFSDEELINMSDYTNIYDYNLNYDLKNDISILKDENYDFKSLNSFKIGAYSTLNGAGENQTKIRLIVENLIPIKRDIKLKFSNNDYKYMLFFYDKNKKLKNYRNVYYDGLTDNIIKSSECSYLGIMVKIDNEESSYNKVVIESINNSIVISKIKSTENTKNNLYEKTIIGLGDSLMYGNLLGNEVTWLNKLGIKNSMTYYNKGANGTPIGGTGDNWAMNIRIDTIVNEIENCDYFVLEGGANDRRTNIILGTVDSIDRTTFAGGIRYIVNKVREKYPKAKILLLTNYQRFTNDSNTNNLKDKDYVDMMIEVAKDMCVPVFDNYRDLGLNLMNENTILWADEGIQLNGEKNGHFTNEAYDWMLKKYESLLNNL